MKKVLAAFLLVILFPLHALAIGEIFKIETSGTEYCGDFNAARFNKETISISGCKLSATLS